MTSIFNRIFRYRQSDGRTPREDYFTEILADVLGKHEALAAAFVGELVGRVDIRHDVDIQTQRSFSDVGRRPDIYMTAHDSAGKRHILIIENKIDAPEGCNQLTDYMKLLEQEEQDIESRTLVYITQHSVSDFDKKSIQFKHFYWYQVYGWIKEWIKKSDNREAGGGELVTELLNLMEDWKMNGEFTAEDFMAAVIYHTSLDRGKALIEIIDQAWNQSEIERVLGEWTGQKSISHGCWRYSPTFPGFGIFIEMGYWLYRKDSTWDTAELGLPSASAAIYRAEGHTSAKLKRPSPTDAWVKDTEYTGDESLWVRKLDEKPYYGMPLSGFYREFFRSALVQIRDAQERA